MHQGAPARPRRNTCSHPQPDKHQLVPASQKPPRQRSFAPRCPTRHCPALFFLWTQAHPAASGPWARIPQNPRLPARILSCLQPLLCAAPAPLLQTWAPQACQHSTPSVSPRFPLSPACRICLRQLQWVCTFSQVPCKTPASAAHSTLFLPPAGRIALQPPHTAQGWHLSQIAQLPHAQYPFLLFLPSFFPAPPLSKNQFLGATSLPLRTHPHFPPAVPTYPSLRSHPPPV